MLGFEFTTLIFINFNFVLSKKVLACHRYRTVCIEIGAVAGVISILNIEKEPRKTDADQQHW
jgi:hypothetical protein